MFLGYQSGEEIKKGDRVLYHGAAGVIEFVATELGDSQTEWFVKQYGGGVMVRDETAGPTFVPASQIGKCEDLELMSRAGG
ncbi:MAG: hypothetical protein ACRD40_00405 [Candidatus Acidiferrales bacterium]